jgi:hypothetical protein
VAVKDRPSEGDGDPNKGIDYDAIKASAEDECEGRVDTRAAIPDIGARADEVFPKRKKIEKAINGMKTIEREKKRGPERERWTFGGLLEGYKSAVLLSVGPVAERSARWREIAWERELVLVDRLKREGYII